MNSHSRSFVKLVQHDLLALSDANLFDTVHYWVETGARGDETTDEELHATLTALGYTLKESACAVHADRESAQETVIIHEPTTTAQWDAPAPDQLRTLLTTMDANQFLQHVIPLAFQSLHTIHPEWGEGMTFYAHLANHLRQKEQVKKKR